MLILSIHLPIVVIHNTVVLLMRQGSEVGNFISEVVALAYLSKSEVGTLKNCCAGIILRSSLRQRARVVAAEKKGKHKVRLVQCDDKQERRDDEVVLIDRKYA